MFIIIQYPAIPLIHYWFSCTEHFTEHLMSIMIDIPMNATVAAPRRGQGGPRPPLADFWPPLWPPRFSRQPLMQNIVTSMTVMSMLSDHWQKTEWRTNNRCSFIINPWTSKTRYPASIPGVPLMKSVEYRGYKCVCETRAMECIKQPMAEQWWAHTKFLKSYCPSLLSNWLFDAFHRPNFT